MNKTLILGTSNGIWLCTLQGSSWRLMHRSLVGSHITCVATQAGRIIAGTKKGIQISTDQGSTWHPFEAGISIPHIRWLFAHPGSESMLLAGTEPACIFISQDGGANWDACPEVEHLRDRYKWYLPYSPEAGCVRGFSLNGRRVYAAVEVGGVLVSEDSGHTWQLAAGSRGGPQVAPAPYIHPDVHSITVHPNSPDLVYAPTGGGFYRTSDGANTWASLYRCYCRAAWVDPDNPHHIILGPADGVDRVGRIEETVDGGETWQSRMDGLTTSWPRHMVERFTQVDDELFAVLSNGDLLTADLNSLFWRPVLGDAGPVNAVAELAL